MPSRTTPAGTAPSGTAADRPKERKTASRQRQISDLVLARGSISAQDLVDEFDVSLMTVHRDLDELEKRGVLRKVRGGVTAQPSSVFEALMPYRLSAMADEKQRLAEFALRYVEPGMSLMLDDSTTVLKMIPGLAGIIPLHVATNFLAGLKLLAEQPDTRLIAIGGDYDPAHDSFQGIQAIEAIDSIQADALFMSTSALSPTHAFHQEERIVAFKRAMISSSTKRYLLVDHSKLDRVALHRVAALSEFDVVITDSAADPQAVDALMAAGITVEVVP
ncbi:MAG: DeoR/GlpR transcriptional regulator [Burkholderiaceae bacterium]|nr:DeoR/GlpR transcriptional regulator [Microbacteriaceae bacterium]